MKNILLGIALAFFFTNIEAQTVQEETIVFPESMQSDMDSLYWDWQSKYLISID